MKEICSTCAVIDNESHRLNDCVVWQETNNAKGSHRVNFNDIFSSDLVILKNAIFEIQKVWELKYANGRMREPY